ncbi:putative GMP synthase [Daphnia magna]|uniref:Putative GMP synthase n=1 Tax=Daphnia magna TaxID=35525 RepID=A0A162NRN6_9CRUS|nr:putative GMP synthase [Daphnia magna]
MFVIVVDRTANDLNVTWDNLLLRQVSLRPDLIGAASHMDSSRADDIKTHHNDSEMVRQLRIYGRVVEPLIGNCKLIESAKHYRRSILIVEE